MNIQQAKAVIFDVDGVLVNTEALWEKAHRQALAESGVPVDREFYIQHGISRDPRKFYENAFRANNKTLTESLFQKIHARRVALYGSYIRSEKIPQVDQAVALVHRLYELEKPLGVASVVEKDELQALLRKIDVGKYFSVVVAGGEYGLRRKPEPDIYLKAAALLGVAPVDCVAIEDSQNGAIAAVAAGMTCLVVPNEFTKDHTFPPQATITLFAEILDSVR